MGPFVLFSEDFSDCANTTFVSFSEASTKNWTCQTVFGENNSGSYGMNGHQEEVASKDWLITKSPIDFNTNTGEQLSFYTDAAYGSSPLELVYSSDYDGAGDPLGFTWTKVPNITIPIKSNTSATEEIFSFSKVDISEITGTVYFAFKYYSNGAPTRWTVDSFKITADENDDIDDDGILNENDNCPTTANPDQADADGDGVGDVCDVCAGADDKLDTDADGVPDGCDICIGFNDKLDTDADGIPDGCDNCPTTANPDQADADGDGIGNVCDSTPNGDDDNDGVDNAIDNCPNTTVGSTVDANGCFTLASNNFTIETVSETCLGENNGQIKIAALAIYNYKATINGAEYAFINNSLNVPNLQAKTYSVCISITGETYTQCYEVTIDAGATIAGKATQSSKGILFDMESGTPPYSVLVNNNEVLNTNKTNFYIENVTYGDVIQVKTAIICEGVLSKTVDLSEEVYAYPNPSKGNFKIALPAALNEATLVELYNMQSQLVFSRSYIIEDGKIQLNMEAQPTGIYIVKIVLNKQPFMLKLIKE